jgi:hypothetical protein
MKGAKKAKEVVIKPIKLETATITIEGDTDLILNKMCRRAHDELVDKRKDKAKTIQSANVWDDIITSMHWRDQLPEGEYTEETMHDLLQNNAPCISAFGLKRSLGDAVVRFEIDQYKTKFDANVNIVAVNGLIPITFCEHCVDEKLMSPKGTGSQVLTRFNRFTGWRAKFTVQYIEGGTYGLEQILQVINLAGFGLGVGSGRSSGYGRFHILTEGN